MRSVHFIYLLCLISCFHIFAKVDLNNKTTKLKTIIFKGQAIKLKKDYNGDLLGRINGKRIRATTNKSNRNQRSEFLGSFKSLKRDPNSGKMYLATYSIFKEPRFKK